MQPAYQPNKQGNNLSSKAELSGNPNITSTGKNTQGYSRSPLSVLLLGGLGKAIDYHDRATRPEKNKDDPSVIIDPETSKNPFAAENRPDERSEWRNASMFLEMYRKGKDLAQRARESDPSNSESKDKGENYDGKYSGNPYSAFYNKIREIFAYWQRTKKEKIPYSARKKEQQSESKKDYKIELNAANDDKKAKSLYEIAEAVITKTYNAVSKTVGYLTSKGYNEKSKNAKTSYSGQSEEDYSLDADTSYIEVDYRREVIPDALPQIMNMQALGRESEDRRRKKKDLEAMIAGNAIAANDDSIDRIAA